MPPDSPAPRLHINTHTWNWKVSSHLPEAEERRKEWRWQWCRKVRELKVNFPRNRKYPSNTRAHKHTHTHTYTDTLQVTEDSNQFLYTIPKKKKAISREMLLFNSHKNGEQYELCKKRITEATTYGNLTCVETYAPPPPATYRILWNSCNNSGLWEAWAYTSFTERNQISEQLGFAQGHPVTMTLSHDESTFVWLLIS